MRRCLLIARNALGSSRPNPMVGSVIVNNNKIIGEGYTSRYGKNHAEVNAINSVNDKSLLKTSTLYVSLEPCSHYGKTPPCSDLIIKECIPKVVIGTVDTHSKVAGKGIERLIAAGIEVTKGILETDCKEHHKRFFTFHNKKRPYIILKWAETLDGFIAPISKKQKKPVWITTERSLQLVHKWRTEEQAILVGTNTVLEDDPSLTARDWKGNNPIRIVIDRKKKLALDHTVFNAEAETIIISNIENNEPTIDFSLENSFASQICSQLFKNNINSVIIEGGSRTLQAFIDENLWDEARVFTGNTYYEKGIKGPKFSGHIISSKMILGDTLKIYTND